MAEKAIDMAAAEGLPKMRLNIVILLLGTRGDLQPVLEIAKLLRVEHGHRVRLATHAVYRAEVEAAGIEFFSTGDKTDPREMQKRRLLTPKELKAIVPTIKTEFDEMSRRWWLAAIGEPGDDFVADAVISTMQAFDHTSVAARLAIPLHMLGTNPRSPSKYLPHSQFAKYAKGGTKRQNKFSFWLFDY